jgi:hypothetical protein
MAEKWYEVPVSFVFTGTFKVKAENMQQAHEYVDKHCGLVLGGDIHSSLPEDVVDWDFDMNPEKRFSLGGYVKE